MNGVKICLLGDARSIHLQRISKGLAQRGVDVRLVTHKPAEIHGVNVETFRVPPPGWTNLRGWSARRDDYVRAIMRQSDIVHVHFLADWWLSPDILSEGCLAVTPWGSDITPPPGEGVPSEELWAVRCGLLKSAQLVTAWGPRFARTISDFAAIPEDRLRIMPLGVDTRLFRRTDVAKSSRLSPLIVGYFKGFRPVYGAPVFVRAMPHIAAAVPFVRFCMIGDGPELEACMQLAAELGVDQLIDWIPRQGHQDLPQHLSTWHISVMPSFQESFGLAALESSALAIPVVASEVGGLPDVVRPDDTGQLFPPGDSAALAGAVITLLCDADTRRRLGAQGRAMVEREFEWGPIMDQWVELYAKLREERMVMV